MAQLEASKCFKQYGYRLNGKVVSKRSIPLTRLKSLAAWFYRQKHGYAPTGIYLKWVAHQEDEKCRWCGS